MLDDIDYSSLTASETPSEKKKEEGIVSRRMKSEKAVAQAKPVDVAAVVERSQELSKSLGSPQPASGPSNYGPEILGGLGVLGALAAAHHHYFGGKKYGETSAGMPLPPKPDIRDFAKSPVVPPAPKYSPEVQALIDRSEANKAAKAADAAAKANPLPVGMTPGYPSAANPMNALTTQPPAPQLIQPKPAVGVPPQAPVAPVTAAPAPATVAPTAPEAITQALPVVEPTPMPVAQVAAPVEPNAPVELRTGTGKIAYAGQGPEPTISKRTGEPQFKKEYASIADIPKGYALVPQGQYIDPLRQDLGQIEYTKAFTGRDFPKTYEEAISTGKEINRSLGRATREEAKAAGLPYGEITPGIAKKTTENKKLVKIAGKAGLAGALVSIADLALADNAEQRANAGVNLLGAVLPPGMDINAAGAPTLSADQLERNRIAYENQFKLGSPFAQTEAAKTYRLREKAGAGRGIAPPSAYRK